MPENYDSMMDKVLEAYATATDKIPDDSAFVEIEQRVMEWIQGDGNK